MIPVIAARGPGKKRGRKIDVNRILTDLLINFRRIVHRGLVNYSGELWYREGLPSDVFRRLVVRKESETPLDRFSGDYEELMTYANFRDLADIIVGNEALSERLTVLKPRDGTSLLDRLNELEEIKQNLSSNRTTSNEDAAKLRRYFDEFRAAIKKAKPAATASSPPSAFPPEEETKPSPEDETIDSIFDEEEAQREPEEDRPGRLVVKVSADGLRKAASDSEPAPAPVSTTEPPAQAANEVDSMNTPVTDVSVRPGPGDDEAKGPVEEAEGVDRALRDDDNAAILKALHIEVTEVADGMLRREPKHGHLVWEQAKKRGWFEAHKDEFELDPLEEFYGLAHTFLDAFASGAKSSELKAILADAGFSKLLLRLREMFLSSRSRV